MIAANGRRVRSGKEFEDLFPPATGNDLTIKKSADVSDTVKFIQDKVPEIAWQTEKFARYIKGKTLEESCSNIWHWVYDHIPYAKDEKGIEQIRSPRRTFHDRNKRNKDGSIGVDCDCYTVFISSILFNLNIPHFYRITKYYNDRGETPRWQHIYVVVPKSGSLKSNVTAREDYITLDVVKDDYDEEQPYLEHKDFKAKMRLDFLDGLDGAEFEVPNSADVRDLASMYDEDDLGKIGQWVKKTVKKVSDKAGDVVRTVNKVANPATILLRNGFLAGMKLNLFNVAGRLRYAYLSDDKAQQMGMNLAALAKVRTIKEKAETIFWQAGGDKNNLKKAILEGKGNKDKKVALSGFNGFLYNTTEDEKRILSGLGQLGDPATATAITAATATITALAAALKQVKDLFPQKSPEAKSFESEKEDPEITTSVMPINSAAMMPGFSQESTSSTLPSTQSQRDVPGTNTTEEQQGFFQKAGSWIKENPFPIILIAGGIGTGIYLLSRKKNKKIEGLSGLPAGKKRAKRKKKNSPSKLNFKPIKIR